ALLFRPFDQDLLALGALEVRDLGDRCRDSRSGNHARDSQGDGGFGSSGYERHNVSQIASAFAPQAAPTSFLSCIGTGSTPHPTRSGIAMTPSTTSIPANGSSYMRMNSPTSHA